MDKRKISVEDKLYGKRDVWRDCSGVFETGYD